MSESLNQQIDRLQEIYKSEKDPQGRAFVPLADAHRRLGDFGKALAVLQEGLDAHPDFASAHMVAGWIHRSRQAPEDAMRSFERVLELDAANSLARAAIAELIDDQRAQAYRDKMAKKEAEQPAVATAEDERPVVPIASLSPDAISAGPPAVQELLAADDYRQVVPIASLAPVGGRPVVPIASLAPEVDRPIVPIALLAPDAPFETVGAPDPPDNGVGASGVPIAALAPDRDEDVPPDADESVPPDWDEDAAPEGSGGAPHDGMSAAREIQTQTLAELYASQGAPDKAAEVYRRLIANDPDNEALQRRLAELQSLGPGSLGAPPQRLTVPIESLAPDGDP